MSVPSASQRWAQSTIKQRLVAVIGSTVLGVILFQITYFPLRDRDNALRGLQSKALAVAQLVSYDVTPALQFGDVEHAHEVLTGAGMDEDVAYFAVYRADGSLFAAWQRHGAHAPARITWQTAMRVHTERGLMRITGPLGASGGGLEGAFSTANIDAAVFSDTLATVALGALIVLLGFLVAQRFGNGFRERVTAIVLGAQDIAVGDLRQALREDGADELAALARAVNAILRNQQQMVLQLAAMATEIKSTSQDILQGARLQESGASEQAQAVHETRHTMASLLQSGRHIGQSALQVLQSAEKTQTNNQVISERINALSSHVQRILEILEMIKDIANKSELLALNASLEGTKAGETGRGFSLVASQIQRLAENIMGAVHDIKALTGDVHDATQASVQATEDGSALAADTTQWARQIGDYIAQQQTGTEHVTRAMDDVSVIAQRTSSSSQKSVRTTQALNHLSQELDALVQRFRTLPDPPP